MRLKIARAWHEVRVPRTVIALAVSLSAASSIAQQPVLQHHTEPTIVKLHIVTQADVPVPLAEVSVNSGKLRVTGRTDGDGVFRVDRLFTGDWHASIRRIGYKGADVDFRIDDGANAFTITLDESASTLSEVKVEAAHPYSARLADYEMRLAHKEASAVVTRSDIEKRNPIRLSQMLRAMPGMKIMDSLGIMVAMSTRGPKPSFQVPGRYCMLRISVDGVVMPAGTDIDNVVPMDVHGVEVFFGPSRVPPGMGGIRLDNWCGLIAIWTRDR
ncbi:MAG: TonB-dependent receptor [Gemmatimonadaceae bacterium]